MPNQRDNYLELIFSLLILPLFTAGFFWLGLYNSTFFFPLAVIIILSIAWLIVRLNLQVYLVKIIALLLPFSFELPLTSGIMIQFPGEILTGIAAVTVIIEIILQPSALKSYLSGEVRYALPLVIIFCVSLLFSSMPVVSAKYTVISITYILVFLFLLKKLFISYPGLYRQMIVLYSLSFSLVILWASHRFLLYDLNPVVAKGIFRPWYKDHTITGASASILCAFWLAGSYSAKRPVDRLLMAAAGFFFLYAVLLTHSRAAILSVAVFVFVWITLQIKIHPRYLAILGSVVLLIIIGLRKPLYDRLYYNKYVSHKQNMEWSEFIKSTGNVTTDDSNVERLNRWYAGIKMFTDRPITGFGPGTYQFAYIPYQNKQLANRLTVSNPYKIPENSGGTAHSEYILALSEMGLPGFIALILLIGRWIWLVFVKALNHPARKKIIVVFAAISTYLFHAFFNNFLNTDKFAFLFWGMAACLLSYYELNHDKQLLQKR